MSPAFLATVIENGIVVAQSTDAFDTWFIPVVCLIIGLFNICFPYGSWYLGHGWRFRDAEPSDLALLMTRISGIIATVIGIGFLVV